VGGISYDAGVEEPTSHRLNNKEEEEMVKKKKRCGCVSEMRMTSSP